MVMRVLQQCAAGGTSKDKSTLEIHKQMQLWSCTFCFLCCRALLCSTFSEVRGGKMG